MKEGRPGASILWVGQDGRRKAEPIDAQQQRADRVCALCIERFLYQLNGLRLGRPHQQSGEPARPVVRELVWLRQDLLESSEEMLNRCILIAPLAPSIRFKIVELNLDE